MKENETAPEGTVEDAAVADETVEDSNPTEGTDSVDENAEVSTSAVSPHPVDENPEDHVGQELPDPWDYPAGETAWPHLETKQEESN